MGTVLLIAGIVVIVAGWIALSVFAVRQMNAAKQYEPMSLQWKDVKEDYRHKRNICRIVILVGILILAASIYFQ